MRLVLFQHDEVIAQAIMMLFYPHVCTQIGKNQPKERFVNKIQKSCLDVRQV